MVVRTVAVSPGCGRRGIHASCWRSGLSGAGHIAPAGDLGPWTGLLGRLGIDPHAPGAAMTFVGYGIVFLGMLITGTCARRVLRALARTRLTIWLPTPVSAFDGPSRSVAASVAAQPPAGAEPCSLRPVRATPRRNTEAGTEGDRRGRGGAVSTPCRLSPKDAAATLLTALLTVRGRTSKKAVGDWLGTGSAAVREGAAPTDAQVFLRSRILAVNGEAPSSRRYRRLDGTTIRPYGRLRFPCEEGRSRRPNGSVA